MSESAINFITGGAANAAKKESVTSQLPGRENGPADALRHILISAELTRRFPDAFAESAMDFKEFKDNAGANSAMDNHNNAIGFAIGKYVQEQNGSWEDVVTLSQKAIESSLSNRTLSDINGLDKTEDGNIIIPFTVILNPDLTIPAISILPSEKWGKHPNGGSIADSNWPDLSGEWLYNFVPELYDYENHTNHSIIPDAEFPDFINNLWETTATTTDTISDSITSAADWFDRATSFTLFTDPLIIDMAGDGLGLDSWQDSVAAFDLNENGTAENTGWTQAGTDDAFLVIDKNNNGNIDDISEMFGNDSTAGFAELKLYDSNNDNVINITDSQFNLLKLWNDLNANGVVDAGEMTTLAANGITQISLQKQNDFEIIQGNIRSATAAVTFDDGRVRGYVSWA